MTPLDAHAHVQPDIASSDLRALDAHIVAVTRTPDEYAQTLNRTDPTTTWALGCHPSLARPQKNFDPGRFRRLLENAAVVGEIGLDGSSRVPVETQTAVLQQILGMLRETPRVSTIHSAGATAELIRLLGDTQPSGVILHWWRGDEEQTRRALALGCYFSVNSREIDRPRVIGIVPRDRILTETDHPSGDRSERPPNRPGNMRRVIAALAEHWRVGSDEVVRQTWENWRTLCLSTGTADLLPRSFKKQMLRA